MSACLQVCMTESIILNVLLFSSSGLSVMAGLCGWWLVVTKHIILQTNSTWKNNKHPAVSNFSSDIMEITWLPPPGQPARQARAESARTRLLHWLWRWNVCSVHLIELNYYKCSGLGRLLSLTTSHLTSPHCPQCPHSQILEDDITF